MSILMSFKDINFVSRIKNRRVLEKYNYELAVKDDTYEKVDHKICLYVCKQNFWLRTDLDYSLMRRVKGEEYEITMVGNGKVVKLHYIEQIWYTEEKQLFSNISLADRCRKSIYYLEIMIIYIRFHYMKEFLEADIITYFKNEFVKYIDFDLISNVCTKKYR